MSAGQRQTTVDEVILLSWTHFAGKSCCVNGAEMPRTLTPGTVGEVPGSAGDAPGTGEAPGSTGDAPGDSTPGFGEAPAPQVRFHLAAPKHDTIAGMQQHPLCK
jgi:hypothetical protein